MSRRVIIDRKVYEEEALDCPDCGTQMLLVPFLGKVIYKCARATQTGCSGTHGAHTSGAPMGIPGNWQVRAARKKVHIAFDQLWDSGKLTRRAADRWLRGAMSLTESAAHISSFDEEQCAQALHYLNEDFGLAPPPDLAPGNTGFVELTF